jgi:hypothetical protein
MKIRLNRAFLVRTRKRYLDRQRNLRMVTERLVLSNISDADKSLFERFLADDFLVDPPAFEW